MLRLDHALMRLGDFVLQVDLAVERGERVAVMGASGSGKSSLLALIAGFMTPDAGRVLLDGVECTDMAVSERPLSILFQDGNLFPHLPVFENVALGLRPDLRLSRDDRARVLNALSKVGLEGLDQRFPSDLSGGQQGRVALARMLLRDRPLALLDEPFAALDPGLRKDMLSLLNTLCQETGLTLVMVSHDLRDAARLCDRIVLLSQGRVIFEASMARALRDRPKVLEDWL